MEGNQMKMREALEWLLGFGYSTTDGGFHMQDAKMVRNKIEAALSAPPRQCDVGTAEEQGNRMRRFCAKQKRNGIINCGYCQIRHQYERDCTLDWAQMPYEKEGGSR